MHSIDPHRAELGQGSLNGQMSTSFGYQQLPCGKSDLQQAWPEVRLVAGERIPAPANV